MSDATPVIPHNRIMAPVRRPAPVMTPDSLALWRALIRQTRERGDLQAAAELETLLLDALGSVP